MRNIAPRRLDVELSYSHQDRNQLCLTLQDVNMLFFSVCYEKLTEIYIAAPRDSLPSSVYKQLGCRGTLEGIFCKQ